MPQILSMPISLLLTAILSSILVQGCATNLTNSINNQPVIELVQWQPCQKGTHSEWFFYTDVDESQECGTINVPIDYEKPNGKHIELALRRKPALSDEPIGNLLIISGGPGENSLDLTQALSRENYKYTKALHKRFNLIGYAPRGVEPSTPAIDCGKIEDIRANIGKDNEVEGYMNACISSTDPDLLNHLSTLEAIQDVESIRQGLGSEKLSIIAYSYGTRVLNGYAERYPDHLRAGVFDAVMDVSLDYFSQIKLQNIGLQNSFDRFIQYCLSQDNCIFKDANDADKNFQQWLVNTGNKNLVDENGNLITAESIIFFLQNSFYYEHQYPLLVNALADLDSQSAQDSHSEQNSRDNKSKKNSQGWTFQEKYLRGLNVISCSDLSIKLEESEYIRRNKEALDPSIYDNFINERTYLDYCYYWPYEGKLIPHKPKVSSKLGQMLFVNNKYDMATPLVNAERMSNFYNAPLITRDGSGHTISFLNQSACVDHLVLHYLIEPSKEIKSQSCD